MTFIGSFIKGKIDKGASAFGVRLVSLLFSLLILTACPAIGPECVEADDWGGKENLTIRVDAKNKYTPAGISVQQNEPISIQISGVVDLCPIKASASAASPQINAWQDTGTSVQKGDKLVVAVSGSYRDRVGTQYDGRGLYMYISPTVPGSTQNGWTFNGDAAPVAPAQPTTYFTELFNNGTTGTNGPGYAGVSPVTGKIYLRYARTADARGGNQWHGANRWEGSRCNACRQTTIWGTCAGVAALCLIGYGACYAACVAGWEGGCSGTGHLELNPSASWGSYKNSKCQEWYSFGSECRSGGYWGDDCFDHWVAENYSDWSSGSMNYPGNSASGYNVVISYGCPGTYGKYLQMDITNNATTTMTNYPALDCPSNPAPGETCYACPSGAEQVAGECVDILTGAPLRIPVYTLPASACSAGSVCDLNSSGTSPTGQAAALPVGFVPNVTYGTNGYRGYYEYKVASSGELWFEIMDNANTANTIHTSGGYFPDNIGSYTLKISTTSVDSRLSEFLNNLINPMRYLVFGYCRAADNPLTLSENEAVTEADAKKQLTEDACLPKTSVNAETGEVTPGAWKPGITQDMYERFVKNSLFINVIRGVMVLLLVVYGFMFMLGMVQQAQEVFIRTTLRIAIISTLISPASWEFFSTYLFGIFINGTNLMIGLLAGDFVGAGNDVDVKNPFTFINGTMTRFFNMNTFIKLVGLLFASPIGILYIIAMLVGIFYFLFAVLRAAILYIIAMLAISLLLVLAPLFISLMLFNFTKGYFDKWILSLINYLFQPVMVVTALSIFNVFVYSAIYALLHYRVCWDTVFSVTIPLGELGDFEVPIFNFYLPKGGLDGGSPLASGMPIGFFMILIFLIITNAMLKFVTYMGDLTAKLTGSASLAKAAEETLASGIGIIKGAGALAAEGAKKLYSNTGGGDDKDKKDGGKGKDGDKGGGKGNGGGGKNAAPRK